MPSLRICGHRTFVAGDDLRFPTILAVLLRILQIVVLIPLTVFSAGPDANLHLDTSDIREKCDLDENAKIDPLIERSFAILVTYLTLAYVMALVGLGLEVGIWRTGAQGTPTQPEERACLQPLCHIKMIPMSAFRLAMLALGLMVLFIVRDFCYCGKGFKNSNVDPTVQCPYFYEWQAWLQILIVTHFIEAAIVGLEGIYFATKSTPRFFPALLSAQAKWQLCCSCCCTVTSLLTCCLFGGPQGTSDFADVAVLLADWFDDGGIVDVVFSDIIVGFRMLVSLTKLAYYDMQSPQLTCYLLLTCYAGPCSETRGTEMSPRSYSTRYDYCYSAKPKGGGSRRGNRSGRDSNDRGRRAVRWNG